MGRDELLQFYEALKTFQTFSCGLMHEQVQELRAETITDECDIDEVRAVRKGFCDAAMRRRTLGCAHSIANFNFSSLADKAYDMGLLQGALPPAALIDTLVAQIYLMDHEKGRVEKEKALAVLRQDTTEMRRTENAIRDIITRHGHAVAELEQLRCDMIQQIEVAIKTHEEG